MAGRPCWERRWARRPRAGGSDTAPRASTSPPGCACARRSSRRPRCAPPGRRARRLADDALERSGLAYVGDWRTSRLDAEGFRRLSLALAIAGDPPLVVLDDPWVLSETLREIASARARGAAVLVAAQRPGGLAPALGRRIVLADGVAR